MGGGKGGVDHYVAIVRPGTIASRWTVVALDAAREACGSLPTRCRSAPVFVSKHD